MLLNDSVLSTGKIHPKAHPDLLAHIGWDQAQGLLRTALESFERAVQLPASSNGSGARPWQCRSFLGLATTSDTARLEDHLRVLQASENRTVKATNFLRRKLATGAELMKEFIREGELQRKNSSRTLVHLQMEVSILLLLKAAEDAVRELTALITSIIQGYLSSDILTTLHDGEVIVISKKNNIPVLTFIVSLLEPVKLNCSQVNENFICAQPGDD